MNLKVIFTILILSWTGIAQATGGTGGREIASIGCHLNNSTCYVYVEGNAVGPESCKSTSIRWNKDSSTNGKETLSLLMAAFAAGKKVNFNIVDVCYGTYPTFNYINVYK